jgi:tripartite-type tricarboxylate transporter receptor subunit TctC
VISIVSGETAILMATIPSSIQHFQSGRLIPLGVTTLKRNPALPDIPSVAEAGVPGYEAIEWNGVVVPTGTPAAVVTRLNQAIVKSLAIPEVKERIVGLGADPVGNSPEEFGSFIKKEIATWSKVIKEVGITIE